LIFIESTAPAVGKHFQKLINIYNQVHIINLLGQKDTSGEFVLCEAYKSAVDKLSETIDTRSKLVYTAFDYHAIVKRDNYERVCR
jgi:hypothetical protein